MSISILVHIHIYILYIMFTSKVIKKRDIHLHFEAIISLCAVTTCVENYQNEQRRNRPVRMHVESSNCATFTFYCKLSVIMQIPINVITINNDSTKKR